MTYRAQEKGRSNWGPVLEKQASEGSGHDLCLETVCGTDLVPIVLLGIVEVPLHVELFLARRDSRIRFSPSI